jgi:hypothetical protein
MKVNGIWQKGMFQVYTGILESYCKKSDGSEHILELPTFFTTTQCSRIETLVAKTSVSYIYYSVHKFRSSGIMEAICIAPMLQIS